MNGAPLGKVDKFERTCEIDPKDDIFCELKAPDRASVCFRFNEAFLFTPPPQIKLFFSGSDVAVYACDFVRADQSTKILSSEQFGDIRLTLIMQGRLQLSFTHGAQISLLPLPDYLENAKIYRIGWDFLLEANEGFALLSGDGKLITQSQGHVLEKDNGVTAELPFADSLGHSAVCTWENGKMTSCIIRTPNQPTEATFALALFESVLIGIDIAPFLCDALQEKAPVLKEFLGKFVSVVLTDEPTRVGLVYERKQRVYDVRYFRVTVTDGKVENIQEE